ncbi:hypothetical protein FOA52_000638 [Chlamydomonas sp. UWO 241]|nr:hypothetical protein FOA52_000638 [Chlamydomonas sp. UWO 241]
MDECACIERLGRLLGDGSICNCPAWWATGANPPECHPSATRVPTSEEQSRVQWVKKVLRSHDRFSEDCGDAHEAEAAPASPVPLAAPAVSAPLAAPAPAPTPAPAQMAAQRNAPARAPVAAPAPAPLAAPAPAPLAAPASAPTPATAQTAAQRDAPATAPAPVAAPAPLAAPVPALVGAPAQMAAQREAPLPAPVAAPAPAPLAAPVPALVVMAAPAPMAAQRDAPAPAPQAAPAPAPLAAPVPAQMAQREAPVPAPASLPTPVTAPAPLAAPVPAPVTAPVQMAAQGDAPVPALVAAPAPLAAPVPALVAAPAAQAARAPVPVAAPAPMNAQRDAPVPTPVAAPAAPTLVAAPAAQAAPAEQAACAPQAAPAPMTDQHDAALLLANDVAKLVGPAKSATGGATVDAHPGNDQGVPSVNGQGGPAVDAHPSSGAAAGAALACSEDAAVDEGGLLEQLIALQAAAPCSSSSTVPADMEAGSQGCASASEPSHEPSHWELNRSLLGRYVSHSAPPAPALLHQQDATIPRHAPTPPRVRNTSGRGAADLAPWTARDDLGGKQRQSVLLNAVDMALNMALALPQVHSDPGGKPRQPVLLNAVDAALNMALALYEVHSDPGGKPRQPVLFNAVDAALNMTLALPEVHSCVAGGMQQQTVLLNAVDVGVALNMTLALPEVHSDPGGKQWQPVLPNAVGAALNTALALPDMHSCVAGGMQRQPMLLNNVDMADQRAAAAAAMAVERIDCPTQQHWETICAAREQNPLLHVAADIMHRMTDADAEGMVFSMAAILQKGGSPRLVLNLAGIYQSVSTLVAQTMVLMFQSGLTAVVDTMGAMHQSGLAGAPGLVLAMAQMFVGGHPVMAHILAHLWQAGFQSQALVGAQLWQEGHEDLVFQLATTYYLQNLTVVLGSGYCDLPCAVQLLNDITAWLFTSTNSFAPLQISSSIQPAVGMLLHQLVEAPVRNAEWYAVVFALGRCHSALIGRWDMVSMTGALAVMLLADSRLALVVVTTLAAVDNGSVAAAAATEGDVAALRTVAICTNTLRLALIPEGDGGVEAAAPPSQPLVAVEPDALAPLLVPVQPQPAVEHPEQPLAAASDTAAPVPVPEALQHLGATSLPLSVPVEPAAPAPLPVGQQAPSLRTGAPACEPVPVQVPLPAQQQALRADAPEWLPAVLLLAPVEPAAPAPLPTGQQPPGLRAGAPEWVPVPVLVPVADPSGQTHRRGCLRTNAAPRSG